MRRLAALTLICVTVAASVACSSDSKSEPTTSPSSPVATSTRVQTPAPTSGATKPPPGATTAGASAEVTGIVGGVNLTGQVIEIKRLSGAAVTEIAVDSATVIRKATGGTIAFKDIRTSDRIIASGALNDRRDQLVAREITVQDVIPGAQPGG